MKKYTKQYEYKNQKFNTCVELNFRNEATHKITTKFCESEQVYIEYVNSDILKDCINAHYIYSINFIDNYLNPKTPEQNILIELGFE